MSIGRLIAVTKFSCVLAGLLGVSASVRGEEAELILYFDGESMDAGVLADQSGHGLNANVKEVTQTQGVKGKGMQFFGSAQLTVWPSPQLSMEEDMSISLWMMSTQMDSPGVRLIKKWKDGKRNYGIYLNRKRGSAAWTASYSGSDYPFNDFHSPKRLTDGRWHQLVVVNAYSEGKLKIYVDGQLIEENELPGGKLIPNNGPLWIGEGLWGVLDEIQIYRGILTPEQIAKAYEENKPDTPAEVSLRRVPPQIKVTGWSTHPFKEPLPEGLAVDDFEAAWEEAQDRITDCQAMLDELEPTVWVAPEQLSLSIAEQFMSYARYDYEHPAENAQLYMRWPGKGFTQADADAYAERIPRQEMSEILQILEEIEVALADEDWLQRRPQPATPLVSESLPQMDGNYFTRDGHVIFPHGFNNMKDGNIPLLASWGAQFADVSFNYGRLFPDSPDQVDEAALEKLKKEIETAYALGVLPNIQLAFGVPEWLKEQYPDIIDAGGHFMPVDLDHPQTQKVASQLIETAMAVFPEDKEFLVKIGNELSFPLPVTTALGDDHLIGKKSVSRYGWDKYAKYLETEYGDVTRLNERWQTNYENFTQASQARIVFENHASYFDACRFNQLRVLEFYGSMRQQIKALRPKALAYVNQSNGKLLQGSISSPTQLYGEMRNISEYLTGIWIERFNEEMDLSGFDTRAMPRQPYTHLHPLNHPDDYAFEWMGILMTYDFQRSISDGRPMFENELHNLQTIVNRDDRIPAEHVRCVQWLQFVQGTALNQMWFWGREGLALDPDYARGQYCSMGQSPMQVNAFLRTAMELDAFAPQVVALARESKPVAILYSESSAIQDVDYLDVQMAVYEGLVFLGLGIDFVTEEQVAKGTLDQYDMIIVAGARNVSDTTVAALESYVAADKPLLRFGKNTLDLNAWGQPRKDVPDLGKSFPVESVKQLHQTLREQVQAEGLTPELQLYKQGTDDSLGLFHRPFTYEGKRYLFVAQIASTPQTVTLTQNGKPVKQVIDILSGEKECPDGLVLQPWEIRLWELSAE